LIDIVPWCTTRRVYPSGALRATNSLPTFPPAPGRFSTTTGWPRTGVSLSASQRPRTSVTLPLAAGTIRRTDFAGYG
jgi:hypothetical protein